MIGIENTKCTFVSMLTAGNIGTSNANASNKFVTMAKMLHRIKNKTTTISIIAKFCCSFSSNLSLEQEKNLVYSYGIGKC